MRIFLNHNKVATCDAIDFEAVSNFTWHLKKVRGKCSAVHSRNDGGCVYLHRFIAERMGLPTAGKFVRNRNGDQLDCSRENIFVSGNSMTPENIAALEVYKASLK